MFGLDSIPFLYALNVVVPITLVPPSINIEPSMSDMSVSFSFDPVFTIDCISSKKRMYFGLLPRSSNTPFSLSSSIPLNPVPPISVIMSNATISLPSRSVGTLCSSMSFARA